MSGSGSLVAAQCGFIDAFLVCFRKGSTTRVDVVETTICRAIDEKGAVESRGKSENIEGGDGVD